MESFLLQLFNAQMRIAAVDQIHPMPDHKIDIMFDKLCGNTKLRDDIAHHAAGIGFAFKERHRMPGAGEKITGGQSCRASANHRYRMSGAGACGFMPALLIFLPAFLQGDFFQLTNVKCAVVVQTSTVVLTLMVADMTGNGRQGIALINQLQRVGIALFAHQADIFRDILLNSAGGNAWCDVAVGEGQFLADINTVIGFPVFLGVRHTDGFFRQRIQPRDVHLSHLPAVRLLQFAHTFAKPQVASRLQQVRRHRDRMNPRGKNFANIELAGAS